MTNVATDFIFDGEMLSEHNMMIVEFNGDSGLETVSLGNNLTFNTIKPSNSDRVFLTNTQYEGQLNSTFQVCKKDSNCNITPLSSEEISEVSRWLMRKDKFYDFSIIQDGYEDLIFKGSFNSIQEIKIRGLVYGLELNFITDSPYAYMDTVRLKFTTTANKEYKIWDMSHEIGYIYPNKFICKCLSSGDLEITNEIEDRTTQVLNCIEGETITFDGVHKIIESDVATHVKIYNDFNYVFFRIANNYKNSLNVITTSLPCEITIEYQPIRKVGIG